MRKYVVLTRVITGDFVPLNGEHRLFTMFEAAVETFACRLGGVWSQIVNYDNGEVVAIVPESFALWMKHA